MDGSNPLIRTIEGNEFTVHCVAFSPIGQYLALGKRDDTIKLIRLAEDFILINVAEVENHGPDAPAAPDAYRSLQLRF